MFKSIQGSLAKRQQSVGQLVHIADITQQAVLEFLQQNYSEFSARVSVRYQESDKTLTIVTSSKTLAGELSLHVPEFKVYLLSRNIRVERIIVR